MIVGVSGVAQPSTLSRAAETQPEIAIERGNSLPSNSLVETVNISDTGKQTLEDEIARLKKAFENGELVDLRSDAGQLHLGLMALGAGTVDAWSAKGLQLSEEAVLGAAKAFQDGFRANFEQYDFSMAGSSVAINRHQIVMNSQSVPDWFVQEYQTALSIMDDPEIARAFQDGHTFFSSPPSRDVREALVSYTAIAEDSWQGSSS